MPKADWPESFCEGARLFNEERFFETHEVWEQVWRAAPPAEKDFYQGMIHLTVALYQAKRENWRAAHSQLRRAARRLAAFEPARGDLDLRTLQESVRRSVTDLEQGRDNVAFPRIQLIPGPSRGFPPGPGQ